jgi:hypothetical protein
VFIGLNTGDGAVYEFLHTSLVAAAMTRAFPALNGAEPRGHGLARPMLCGVDRMSKLPLIAIVAGSAFHLACGDTTEAEDSPRTVSASGFPLGVPFEIVNGVISADSNEYGLQGSLAVTRTPSGASIEITSDTGQICMRGELAREVAGPFGGPIVAVGFITGRGVMAQLPDAGVTLNLEDDPHALSRFYGAATRIVIDPFEQEPWNLGDGRVLGIEANVTGPAIPFGTPGFGANPGGQNPDELINQYAPACDGSIPPSSGERRIEGLFADLHYYCWNTAQLPYSGWTADSTIVFGWGAAGARVPNTPENANASSVRDPFEFCLSDIRPILAGDADEP